MKNFKFALTLISLFVFTSVNSQVKTDFNNKDIILAKGKFTKLYNQQVDFEIPKKDISELLAIEKREAEKSTETKPFQLAEPIAVDLDIANSFKWIYEDEFAFGKFAIKLNGAMSASINFDKFYLPAGSEMYIYNENGNMITGPVTENENNAQKTWGSWVYKGEYITIELKTPIKTLKQLLLHSGNLAYGYKEVYRTKAVGFGQSGSCNINVICPLGNGWEAERNSVAIVLSGNGGFWCSGALVRNTCNTNRPLFLTADHCFNPPGLSQQNVSQWRFNFQDWSSTCPYPGTDATGVTYNGSTLKANWGNSDFCLVELNTTPPNNSGINYAGWSRSTTPALNATGIHHPKGDVMKISNSVNPTALATFSGYPANNHWLVSWTQGVTEEGSSGSPLFNQAHQIVGQLTGGPSICGGTALRDYYGRFDLSWTGGGTNSTRLSNWLDPTNSGVITTTTANISGLVQAPVNNIFLPVTGNGVVCGANQTYTITGTSPGATVTWQLLRPIVGNLYTLPPQNICSMTTNGTQATLTKIANGNVRLFATITYCDGSKQYAGKDVTFGVSGIANNGAYAANNGSYITITSTVHFTTGTTTAISMANPANNTYTFTKQTAGSSSNSSLINWSNGNVGAVFAPPVNSQTKINLSVQTANACGTSNSPLVLYYTGPSMRFALAPNPASDVLILKTIDNFTSDALAPTTTLKRIQIVNKMGVTVLNKLKPVVGKTININVSTLVPDVYTVILYSSDGTEQHKLIIKR